MRSTIALGKCSNDDDDDDDDNHNNNGNIHINNIISSITNLLIVTMIIMYANADVTLTVRRKLYM